MGTLRSLALAATLLAAAPLRAQDTPPVAREPAAPSTFEVTEVDLVTRELRLAAPDGSELVLQSEDYLGRMENEFGFAVTLDAVRTGLTASVWFDGEGDVQWIVLAAPDRP